MVSKLKLLRTIRTLFEIVNPKKNLERIKGCTQVNLITIALIVSNIGIKGLPPRAKSTFIYKFGPPLIRYSTKDIRFTIEIKIIGL